MAAKDIPFHGTLRLGQGSLLRMYDTDESHYIGHKPPASVTSSVDYTWPPAPPSGEEYLLSSNASGVMSWATRGDVLEEDAIYVVSAAPTSAALVDMSPAIELENGKDYAIELKVVGRYDPYYEFSPAFILAYIFIRWNATAGEHQWTIDQHMIDVQLSNVSRTIDNVASPHTLTIRIGGADTYTVNWTGTAKVLSV